ncbi:MAG: hypothetical protein ACJ761_11515 [Chloroflexota bacterium]
MPAASVVRGALLVLGSVLLAGGLVAAVAGGLGPVVALWLVGNGLFLVVVVLFERRRYRSEAADRRSAAFAGDEPAGSDEPRFRPTDEVFIDPTTQRRMRVLLDASTGERRYVAEG